MDAIDAFLARQSDAGVRESEGSFTVSGDRALSKLANHQLPRNTAWILKMVQAGVAARCQGIAVTQAARSCAFRFQGGDFGTLEQLREAWLQPAPVLTTAQRHLMVAVRSAGFSRRRPILIGYRCREKGLRTLFWDSQSLSDVEPVAGDMVTRLKIGWPELDEFVVHVSSSPLGPDRTVRPQKGVREGIAAEYKELQRYAVCCPIPLTVDARSLNHFGMEDRSMTRRPILFSAQAPEHAERPVLHLPKGGRQVEELKDGVQLAWTLYHSREPGPSTLSWVNGGVVCQEQELHLPADQFRVRLFVPGEDLETDLTALHLRFPEPQEQHRRVARAALDFCRELQPGSPLLSYVAKGSGKTENRWGTVLGLVFGGVMLAPATSGLSLLIGGGAALGVAATSGSVSASKTMPAFEDFRASMERRYSGHEV